MVIHTLVSSIFYSGYPILSTCSYICSCSRSYPRLLLFHFYVIINYCDFYDKLGDSKNITAHLVAVAIILLLLGVQLDDRVNTHDGNASLDSTLQLLNLAHTGLQNTGLQSVVNASLRQIQSVVAVRLLLGNSLLLLVSIAILHTL